MIVGSVNSAAFRFTTQTARRLPLLSCQASGYLPSFTVSPPLGWYRFMLLGEQRHVCVNDFSIGYSATAEGGGVVQRLDLYCATSRHALTQNIYL